MLDHNQYGKLEHDYISNILRALSDKTLVPFMLYDYQHIPWKRLVDEGIKLKRFSSKGDYKNLAPGEKVAIFDDYCGFRSSHGLSSNEKGDEFVKMIEDSLNDDSIFLPYFSIRKLQHLNAKTNFINDEHLMEITESKAAFSEIVNDKVKQLDWIPLNSNTFDLLSQFVETPQGAVLRPDTGLGGKKMFLLRNIEDVQKAMHYIMTEDIANQNSYYFSAYIPSHPISASACIFEDGTIKVYPACYQLIGTPECGDSPFKYCGGDYSAAKFISYNTLNEIESVLIKLGNELHTMGFRGLFGMDFILDYYEQLFYIETNLRFVSPNYLIENFSHDNGICDPFLDHIAAFLGISPGEKPSMNEWKTIQSGAQVLVYNNTEDNLVRNSDILDLEIENISHPLMGLTDFKTPITKSSLLATIRTNESATLEGRLLPNLLNAIDKLRASYEIDQSDFSNSLYDSETFKKV